MDFYNEMKDVREATRTQAGSGNLAKESSIRAKNLQDRAARQRIAWHVLYRSGPKDSIHYCRALGMEIIWTKRSPSEPWVGPVWEYNCNVRENRSVFQSLAVLLATCISLVHCFVHLYFESSQQHQAALECHANETYQQPRPLAPAGQPGRQESRKSWHWTGR